MNFLFPTGNTGKCVVDDVVDLILYGDRIAAYPVIEEALYTWVEHANQVSQVISSHIL